MCLRFAFLLITRAASWLRLSRREETWKTAEILILRHQLAVLQRHQPRRPTLNWADRALLAALFAVIPNTRRQGLRLLVTPDTILRWHRNIVRRRWAAVHTQQDRRVPGERPLARVRRGRRHGPQGHGGAAGLGHRADRAGMGQFRDRRGRARLRGIRYGTGAPRSRAA